MAEPIILDEFCPYCRRAFRLTSDGALRKHRAVPGDADHCAGSGYRPFKTRSKADCPHCHPENFPRREETIMHEPTKIEGVDYSPEGIKALQQELIKMRVMFMENGAAEFAREIIVLSHTIAILDYHIERNAQLIEMAERVVKEIPWLDDPGVADKDTQTPEQHAAELRTWGVDHA